MSAVSPLAPIGFPVLSPIAGVRLAAYAAAIRYAGRDDLMLAELAPGQHGCRRADPIPDCGCAGDVVPGMPDGGSGSGYRREFRQRQCLYRTSRQRGGRSYCRCGGAIA